ncbi:nitrate/nitrite transporter NrtS [Planctobacterium marinum]|uniref:nitrate/nitrite transporter NrtS n=1 Tax=Planctobacterium marinum TaxID=1631968 RepID=UPI0030C6EB5D
MFKPNSFFSFAFSAKQCVTSIKTALLVGTILNLINQWPAITGSESINLVQFCLTYLVPYCVATYAGAKASIQLLESNKP